MADRVFLLQQSRIKSVPWALVAPYERRAGLNHSQSLATLSSRGGLSPQEMYCLLRDVDLREGWGSITVEDAERYIETRVQLLTQEAPRG